jgi:hypothetical protein
MAMGTTLSLNMILVWFVWGFVMGAGWTFAAWLVNRLLSKV